MAAAAPQRSNADIERFVVVVGESGVGKSSIVNMLYNQESTADCCKFPCHTGSSAASVTKASALHINLSTRWCFVDTVGIGDPEMNESDLLGAIRKMIRQTTCGLHCVVVVVNMLRLTAASRANLELLQKLFHAADLKSHGMLVLTHWEGEIGEEEADLAEWIKDDMEIKMFVQSYAKVVLTNNNLSKRGQYPECREKCLQEMYAHINECKDKIRARDVNLMELIESLLSKFRERLWKRCTKITDFVGIGQTELPTYCGECPVCFEQMDLQAAVQLNCKHSFHEGCVAKLGELQIDCPLCRATWATGDWFSYSCLGR